VKSARAILRAAFFGVATVVWSGQASISIYDFSSQLNDRFANSSSFVAYDYNLSGIGLDNNGQWLTMISPNVFLSANHFHPSTGASVTFYASNDPNGLSVTRTVTSTAQRIGTSDLWIGTINEPLPNSFVYYDFATQDITSLGQFNSSPYKDAVAFILGRSPTVWPTSQDMAVGRNKLDRWFDSITVVGTTDDAMGAVYDGSSDPNFVLSEARVESGDSGAGMFVPSAGGKLTLVGINWFQYTAGSETGSGFSYVGNYDGQIQSFLNAYSVPEPSVFGTVAGLVALGWGFSRRLRKSSG